MVSATPSPGAVDPAATAAADEVTPFDITGELPEGTTLLEASAGTGKTFTIAGLVTRYVAEGHATIDELLVITFTRAASQELRDRVRAQLLEAERALGDPTAAAGDNQVLGLLVRGSADERALRRERIADALAAFDTATIATTHQFCQQVLTSLGVAGDSDPGTALVEDIEEQRVEVVDDLYLARYGNVEQKPPFDRAVALTVAREAVADPQATIAGLDAAVPDPRARFAADVRHELDQRKRRLGILGYDDLLSRLAAALRAPESLARERMRRRWKFVLVDEFQDTDPVQWEVIREAFVGHATVVLIGDPKQAIYAFRGGDVATYLAASALATKRATLGTNWRADAPLVARTNVLLDG
ncbi:MAG: UvrD-helicase domain-containing protein, partial [Nocardioides sp.]